MYTACNDGKFDPAWERLDAEEALHPEDNSGLPTIEAFLTKTGETIWNNATEEEAKIG